MTPLSDQLRHFLIISREEQLLLPMELEYSCEVRRVGLGCCEAVVEHACCVLQEGALTDLCGDV